LRTPKPRPSGRGLPTGGSFALNRRKMRTYRSVVSLKRGAQNRIGTRTPGRAWLAKPKFPTSGAHSSDLSGIAKRRSKRSKQGGLSLSGVFFVDKLGDGISLPHLSHHQRHIGTQIRKHAGEVRPWLTLARCKLPTMMRWRRGTTSWRENCWFYGAMRW